MDRVFGNQEFLNDFPSGEVVHQLRQGSDHAPLHVICSSENEPAVKPFRFLNFWTKHPDFKKLIKDNWRIDFVGCPFYEFQGKIKKIKGVLARWCKETFGNLFQRIATLEDELKIKEIQFEMNNTPENKASLKKTEEELNNYLKVEEEFWKQKAGMKWFKDGDRNTRFFHNYVKGRRKKLKLTEI